MILFIYGASGVGKSTILSLLKESDLDVTLHDFDDIGVPKGANKQWRQQATNQWILRAIDSNSPVCILGGAVPGEVISTPTYLINKPDVKFLLLDCNDAVRYARLEKRKSYGPNQDIMNWASWLRLHSYNPQWAQHVVLDGAWNEMNFINLKTLPEWSISLKPDVIDSSDDNPIDTAKRIRSWLSSILPCSKKHHIHHLNRLPKSIENRMSHDLVAYEKHHGIDVNYERNNMVIFNRSKLPLAVLSYYTCFAEIYIDDIWVSTECRGQGLGKKLITELEKRFSGQGFNNINCVTSQFQAPEFYKKCGFSLEFTRINTKNPKLTKYFFVKFFNESVESQGLFSS